MNFKYFTVKTKKEINTSFTSSMMHVIIIYIGEKTFLKSIPNITFQSGENEKEFELLNISDLFYRISEITSHNPNQPHRISFFALLIITQGTGKHYIDLKTYDLKEGTVLKIAKGQVHKFQEKATYDGVLILFTENFVFKYFSKSSINLIPHLFNYHLSTPIAQNKENNAILIDQLNKEFQTNNTYAQKNIIAALLDIYLLNLARKAHANPPKKEYSNQLPIFIQFKKLLESDYKHTRNVKDFADRLSISPKSLNQIVKAFTLDTAKNFIDDYVLLEAKRTIISTNKSLKEIAFDVGFEEVSNFSKFFKNKIGITPKEFRMDQMQ